MNIRPAFRIGGTLGTSDIERVDLIEERFEALRSDPNLPNYSQRQSNTADMNAAVLASLEIMGPSTKLALGSDAMYLFGGSANPSEVSSRIQRAITTRLDPTVSRLIFRELVIEKIVPAVRPPRKPQEFHVFSRNAIKLHDHMSFKKMLQETREGRYRG